MTGKSKIKKTLIALVSALTLLLSMAALAQLQYVTIELEIVAERSADQAAKDTDTQRPPPPPPPPPPPENPPPPAPEPLPGGCEADEIAEEKPPLTAVENSPIRVALKLP